GWLIEWRLIFPTLPALCLALAISDTSIARRVVAVITLILAIIGTALLAATLWSGHPGAVGLAGLLWAGKGVGTGWGGFSNDKWLLLAVGMGEYLFGGAQLTSSDVIAFRIHEWCMGLLVEAAVFAAIIWLLWSHRDKPQWRAGAAVLLGT